MTDQPKDRDLEPDDGSVLLPFDGDDDGDDSDGLELDDRQAEEIQQVFLTTLPQYLEPVAEMLDQLIADGAEGKAETHHALRATLSSLSEAASRIGVTTVYEWLGRMRETVAGIDPSASSTPPELREQIRAELREIERITGRRLEAVTDHHQPTLFAALRGVTGVDEVALGRLTAAGLVTVEQLHGATLDEIMAVSGLSKEVVQRVVDALEQPARTTDGANVVDLPLEDHALRAQLQRKLRAQVEAEAALAEVRAEVERLRSQNGAAERALREAESLADQLENQLSRVGDDLSARVAELANARADHSEASRRGDAAVAAVAREEQRLVALRDELAALLADEARFGAGVETLVAEVERMLEATLRW